MDKGTRGELLDRLAAAIESVTTSHPLRVAVDGPPAAGKTTLADELALLLRTRGREVIRASTEGFHLPRARRYRGGEFSPEANYHDAFDYDALRRVLLDPLGPDGDRRYQHAVYDVDTDTALSRPATTAADLHRHLEGSIRPATAIELAARAGISKPPAQWRSAFVAADREEGLLPYLAKIENATALVRTLDDWRRVTAEAITDAFTDGLAALELRFSPQFITGMTDLDADDVIEAVSDAVSSAALPIEVGLIGIIVRDEGPDSATAQVRRLLRHKSALVGVDLAGDEAGHPAALFASAFRLAREAGLPATVHAGEAAGDDRRTTYEDHPEPERRRDLIRLWLNV
jgi:Adenosine deaminase